jgi:hypothetical protein
VHLPAIAEEDETQVVDTAREPVYLPIRRRANAPEVFGVPAVASLINNRILTASRLRGSDRATRYGSSSNFTL